MSNNPIIQLLLYDASMSIYPVWYNPVLRCVLFWLIFTTATHWSTMSFIGMPKFYQRVPHSCQVTSLTDMTRQMKTYNNVVQFLFLFLNHDVQLVSKLRIGKNATQKSAVTIHLS
jgi:hypothetical protein